MIHQIAHPLGHLSPHTGIGEYRFPALLVEFLDAVLFYILLAAHLELLFHLYLYRKTVGIPAGFTVYLISLHGLCSGRLNPSGVLAMTWCIPGLPLAVGGPS